MKKFKLTSKLNLIKIYQNGQLQECIKAYEKYTEELKEYYGLHDYFIEKYFPELDSSNRIDETKITWEEFIKLPRSEKSKYYLPKANGPENRKNIQNDPNLDRLIELSKTVLTKKDNKVFIGVLEYRNIQEQPAKDIFNNILGKLTKHVIYTTCLQDAEEAGLDEVVDFIKSHPLHPYLAKQVMMERNAEIYKKIRLDSNKDVEEFSELMGFAPRTIKDIERGKSHPVKPLLEKYADLYGVTIDEFLDKLNLKLVKVECKYFDDSYFKTVFKDENSLKFNRY